MRDHLSFISKHVIPDLADAERCFLHGAFCLFQFGKQWKKLIKERLIQIQTHTIWTSIHVWKEKFFNYINKSIPLQNLSHASLTVVVNKK